MSNSSLILRPALTYTVQNAKDDAGNLEKDLRPYLKITDYETDKETLVSDTELSTILASYATNIAVENALSYYTTKTLLNESISDRPTFEYITTTLLSYAALNGNNTFTGTNTFNSNVSIGGTFTVSTASNAQNYMQPFDMFAPNMENGKNVIFKFGKSGSKGDCGCLGFQFNGSDNVNNFVHLGFFSYDCLYRFYRNKAEFTQPLSITGTITSTGDITAPNITTITNTLANKADSNHTHEISDITNLQTTLNSKPNSTDLWNSFGTKYLVVNGGNNSVPLRAYSSSSGLVAFSLGKNENINGCATFRYILSNTHLEIGFWGNDGIFNIYTNKSTITNGNANINGTLTVTGNISAPNITTISNNVDTLTDQMLATQEALTGKANGTLTLTKLITNNELNFTTTQISFYCYFQKEPLNNGYITFQVNDSNYGQYTVRFDIDVGNKTLLQTTVSNSSITYESNFYFVSGTTCYVRFVANNFSLMANFTSVIFIESDLLVNHIMNTNAVLQDIVNNSMQTNINVNTVQIQNSIATLQNTISSQNLTISNVQSSLNGKANTSHTHTLTQISDLNDLKVEIFKMIYPIGSVYQTFEPINNHNLTITDANENIIVEWNNCQWQLLDSGTFIRNVEHETTGNNPYEHNINNSGETGGEATHTLTINEIPTHTHSYSTLTLGGNNGGFMNVADANAIYVMPETGTAGGNQPHNNLPPYITCYMYKRIL